MLEAFNLQGIISIPPAVSPSAHLAIRVCFILAFFLTHHKGSLSLLGNQHPSNSSWGTGAAKWCLAQAGLRGLWFPCPTLCPELWLWGLRREALAILLRSLQQGTGQKWWLLSSLCLCSSQANVNLALNIWHSDFKWLVWARTCFL